MEITPVADAALAARRASGDYDAMVDRQTFRDSDPGMNLDLWVRKDAAADWLDDVLSTNGTNGTTKKTTTGATATAKPASKAKTKAGAAA